MKQRDVFLGSEGDAWFQRNPSAVQAAEFPQSDPLLFQLVEMFPQPVAGTRVLEIGCGDGARLEWLKLHRDFECYGVEPSAQAVEAARRRGIRAEQGTAEQLPFEAAAFDIVLFGFCLYLCDREDLFRIASEADRVLRNPGWLLILDFYAPTFTSRDYRHRAGVCSHKMDYRTLFTWHPGYACYVQKVAHHATHGLTDEPDEWIATSVLRKNPKLSE
ncbi:MAG: class I SAM-dependent methyltransferase [Gammaproteobacteria bacterium]